jgi:hypothetical protein
LERLEVEIARRVEHDEPIEAVARDLSVPSAYAAAVAELLIPTDTQGETMSYYPLPAAVLAHMRCKLTAQKSDHRPVPLIDTAIARPDARKSDDVDLNLLAVTGVRRKAELNLSPAELRQRRLMSWLRAEYPNLADGADSEETLAIMAETAFAMQTAAKQREVLGATAGYDTPGDSNRGASMTQPVAKAEPRLIDSAFPSTVQPVAKAEPARGWNHEAAAAVLRGHFGGLRLVRKNCGFTPFRVVTRADGSLGLQKIA